MSRITKYEREQMVEVVLVHGFSEKLAAVNAELSALGDKIYAEIFKESLKHIDALPNDFAYSSRSFNINVNGQVRPIRTTGHKRLPHNASYSRDFIAVMADAHELVVELNQLTDKKEKIEAAKRDAKRNAIAVLDSVTTYKKLWQIWPESHEILKRFDRAPTEPMLPSAPIKDLNSALGLPTDKGVAA